jgi:hypothetical protein
MALDDFKTHLAGPAKGTVPVPLRGRTPDIVRQEIYALLIVYNMIRAKMQAISASVSTALRQISFIQVLNLVRFETVGALLGIELDSSRLHLRTVNRGTRCRHYERSKKNTRDRWPDRTADYGQKIYEHNWQQGTAG